MRLTIAVGAALLLLAGCEQKRAPLPQAAAPAEAGSAADISAGRAKYGSFCAGCHGPKAEGIAHYPKLAGQTEAMLAAKLAAFRSGQKVGDKSASMIPIARMLTETEVRQVARYLSSLK
ncbi:MAG: c-type cytochrome [Betaproteobacteria bacterium]|nr:c-type cytochrome [Betaproteobacteria bacterium]